MKNVSELFWNMSIERNILAFTGFSVFVNSNEGIEISQLFSSCSADK